MIFLVLKEHLLLRTPYKRLLFTSSVVIEMLHSFDFPVRFRTSLGIVSGCCTSLIGCPYPELIHPDDLVTVAKVFQSGTLFGSDFD